MEVFKMSCYKNQTINAKHNSPYDDGKKFVLRIIILFSFLFIWLLASSLHAEILFSQDFDDDTSGTYLQSEFDEDWNTNFIKPMWQKIENTDIVDGADAYSGKSLRVTYLSNQVGGGSGAQWRCWITGHDELYLSFWLKFKSDFDFVKGGKLPGLCGGECKTGGNKPDGTDGWSGRGSWHYIDPTRNRQPLPGFIYQYVYNPDSPTNYGESQYWNEGDMGPVVGDPGKWHHYEIRYVINTPGEKNGIIQAWFDGKLATERTNWRFRDVYSFNVDNFIFSSFFGGGDSSFAPSKNEYAYFDNIIISTHRVGSTVPDQVDLSPPKNLRLK
jgi:hypothetical protein